VNALIDLWFVIIVLAFVGGIFLRLYQTRLPTVELRKVSMAAAVTMTGEFLASSYDGDFGFPSGLFEVVETEPGRIVAREYAAGPSHFTTILRTLYMVVLSVGEAFGCLGMAAALIFCFCVTPVFLYAALTEVALRHLLRSQIVAELAAAPDGTAVTFTLRGPVALLVGRRLRHAFAAPVLPPRIATLARIPLEAGSDGRPGAAAAA
jgi:hypothetical protein